MKTASKRRPGRKTSKPLTRKRKPPSAMPQPVLSAACLVALRGVTAFTRAAHPEPARPVGVRVLFTGLNPEGARRAAQTLAQDLMLKLQRTDLRAVVSKYIGETEKNLNRIFAAAEKAGVVLFFDEADALFGKRTGVKDSHDRYANLEVSYLLQRIEEFSGVVILSTNRRVNLDQAFVRRFQFVIPIPPHKAVRRVKVTSSRTKAG